MSQFDHPYWEDDMEHNCTHDPPMFNHLNFPIVTLQKVDISAHDK
jgi:hypothetical protein